MIKLLIFFLLCCVILPLTLARTLSAEGADGATDHVPEEFSALLDALPEDLRESLPQTLFSDSAEELRLGDVGRHHRGQRQ